MKARVPPPIVMLVCGTLMWVVARWATPFDFALPQSALLFWVVLLAGFAVLVSGILTILRHKTVIMPDKKALPRATVLVTGGVFRYTRNPIYLGMTIMLMAWVIRLENWLSITGVIMFVVLITVYQIRPEEEALEKIFDEDYLRYKQKVRRWL